MGAILVTGGAGYIGSHVVRQLSEAGHEVIVFDNLSTGSADALINGERLIVGDLADEKKIGEVLRETGCKSVLHFAAAIVAPESVLLPLKYYSNNTRNTLNLIKACVDNQVERFIFSSTAAVYGIPEGGHAAEDSPTVPINPYGTSKLMSEWMLRDAAFAYGFSYVALRYFNVAGADPQARMGQRTPDATHLIKVACQAALGMRDSVSIFGTDYNTPDGTGIRDYIHIEDLAAAHLYALKYLEQGGTSSTINVGYGQGGSVREVIKVVKEVSGVDFKVVEGPRRPGDPADLVAVADRIRSVLGWTPRYNSLRTIIEDAWRWEKKLFEKQK
ncbi:UDP-glucose/UDP-N-acetylglucosamine 4-epimerase [Citrifermentans bemidjiense Bem]|uniref:UDP-glucose 4-epimerase n=1 Tax=Citrifermentans bemidjiense (strain ATCC BAA-1014 / DSM 16622 / JCM 12645 / Bem) TaxID=404380 RepID=B5E9P0_CITBB|nr:UDP-glucose 4-epimerase GalE [Citrifermentans bemidjiense]ACH40214.1 UDP-glucose/UDP-N-acetylglucosamine 4-epimerase [Citrifermentans bemidjiense Bem]